jgi:periodic tryptophan protein 1
MACTLCMRGSGSHARNSACCGAEPSTSGNFAAVSTFEPEIEIWDLDVIDSLQPVLVLGGHAGDAVAKAPERRSKKRRNKEGYKEGSHTDSVLALAWNAAYRNVLASGSADKSIKVWVCSTVLARAWFASS